ncbi:MAG: PqqD family protein [Sphingomonas bacterium]
MMLTIPTYITWQDVDGELALFDERDDRYHLLNGTAAAIWRGIAAGADRNLLIDRIAAGFRVQAEDIVADIDAFIEAASAQGLLLRSDAAPSST